MIWGQINVNCIPETKLPIDTAEFVIFHFFLSSYWIRINTVAPSPQCYILNFKEIGQLVPEKKILKVFFTIYGYGGHLGHVTSIVTSNIHFLVPESFPTKFGLEWHSSF